MKKKKKKICPAFEKSEDKNNSNWKRFLQLHPRNKETEWGRVEEETFFFFFGIQSIDITCMWINCPSVSESFNCHHTTVDSIIYLKKKIHKPENLQFKMKTYNKKITKYLSLLSISEVG